MNADTPRGIAGLVGREPIAAALTVGIKGRNGAPTEKDRFHVLDASPVLVEYQKRDGGSYKAPTRDGHASFGAFNAAAPDRRRIVPARLAHGTIPELFEFRRQCASGAAGIPVHPSKGPVCIGDGERAIRWDGNDYQPIPCPGDHCPYAISKGDKKSPCGPWMRFLGRFDFPAGADGRRLPTLPFKFTSGGWNTIKEFVGFFDAFKRACEGFGVDPNRVPLFGMPVLLTLREKSNPQTQQRFPIVSIQVAGDGDLITWIAGQLERGAEVRRLAASSPLALTDRELADPSVVADDQDLISGLSVPAVAK